VPELEVARCAGIGLDEAEKNGRGLLRGRIPAEIVYGAAR
jgi:hypothetical protein